MASRGVFIVIDGPDGAGKSTLARRIAERARAAGFAVEEVREPGGTPLAEAARRAVLDEALAASPAAELFLILAARADLVAKFPIYEKTRKTMPAIWSDLTMARKAIQ